MIYPSADASHMLVLLMLILCLCASTVLKHVEAVAARPQPRLVLSMSSSAHANGGRRLSDIAAADPEDAWHPEVSCGGVQVERAAAPSAAELLNLLERDLASQAAEDHAHTVSCKGYGKNKGKGKDTIIHTQTSRRKAASRRPTRVNKFSNLLANGSGGFRLCVRQSSMIGAKMLGEWRLFGARNECLPLTSCFASLRCSARSSPTL